MAENPRTNTTGYQHPQETNLLNVHKAMQYNTSGEPVLRTHVDGISLEGDVLVSNVTIDSGNVTVWQGTRPWEITGNANVLITGNISGITTLPAITGNVGVSGNVSITQMPGVSIVSIPEVEIKNDVGNAIPVSWQYTDGATLIPWQVQVARGKISGVTGLSISGYSPSVGTSFIPAWELDIPYTYLPSAQVLRVWSNSASDTNVSVLITGLDANYVQQTETVVLTNGVTGVLSTKQFLRVNIISLAGSVQNVGEISVGNSGKTIVSAYMGNVSNISAGRSQMSVYTVPAGYTFYLTQSNWYTNQTGSQTAFYRSWTQSPAGIVNIVLTFPMQQQYNSTKVVPRAYPEKTDIQWQVASSSGTSQIGGQVEGYLIANLVA